MRLINATTQKHEATNEGTKHIEAGIHRKGRKSSTEIPGKKFITEGIQGSGVQDYMKVLYANRFEAGPRRVHHNKLR